jgi:hypothetical protein
MIRPFHKALLEWQKSYFKRLFAESDSIEQAAALAGLDRSNLKRRLRRLGLDLKPALERDLTKGANRKLQARLEREAIAKAEAEAEAARVAAAQLEIERRKRRGFLRPTYDRKVVEDAILFRASPYAPALLMEIVQEVREVYPEITERTVCRYIKQMLKDGRLQRKPSEDDRWMAYHRSKAA